VNLSLEGKTKTKQRTIDQFSSLFIEQAKIFTCDDDDDDDDDNDVYRAICWIVVTVIPDYTRVHFGLTCDCCDK